MSKVVVIGDRCSYALHLNNTLYGRLGGKTVFYGPKKTPLGLAKRTVVFKGFKNYKPVWTTFGYLVQIPRALRKDRPYVVHFDLTLTLFGSSYASVVPLAFMIPLLRLLSFRVVLTVHDIVGHDVQSELYRNSRGKRFFIHIGTHAFYRLLGFSNALVTHSVTQKQQIIEEFHVNGKKIHVLPFGIEEQSRAGQEKVRRWKDRLGTSRAILFLGTIGPRKGLEYLIEAYSSVRLRFPDTKLFIAGPVDSEYDQYFARVLELAKKLPPSSYEYLGYLEEADADAVIEASRIGVLPYVYAYASPSILYWIFQHKKPVVASKIGALAEELIGYPEILLVQPRDCDGLAKALVSFFGDSALEQESVDFVSRKSVEDSWSNSGSRLVEIYQELNKG